MQLRSRAGCRVEALCGASIMFSVFLAAEGGDARQLILDRLEARCQAWRHSNFDRAVKLLDATDLVDFASGLPFLELLKRLNNFSGARRTSEVTQVSFVRLVYLTAPVHCS